MVLQHDVTSGLELLNSVLDYFFQDHDCQNQASTSQPKASAAASKAAQAAMNRQEQTRNTSTIGSAIRSSASTASNRIMGQSSIRSIFQSQPSQTNSTSTQRVSEDEALARALHDSLNVQQTARSTANSSTAQNTIEAPKTMEEQDLMLAQALAESQREGTRPTTSAGGGDKSCAIC